MPEGKRPNETTADTAESAGRIAVLCMLPSAGHLLPLVRIAVQAEAAGFDVCFFTPDEVAHLVENHGLPVRRLGEVSPRGARASLTRLASQGRLRREFLHGFQIDRAYFWPTRILILDKYEAIRSQVVDFAPDIVLADDHRVPGLYRAVADACSAPLVLHSAMGPRSEDRDVAMRIFGDRWFVPLLRRPLAWAETLSGRARWRWLRIMRPPVYSDVRDSRRRLKDLWDRVPEPSASSRVIRIRTGIGRLEERHLGKVQSNGQVLEVGSLPPLRSDGLEEDMLRWIRSDTNRPTILISFGTMIESDRSLGNALVAALASADMRGLFVGPRVPWEGTENPVPEHVRWERFISQPDALAHEGVHAFVTHAGAGSVQEALWYGKPMLCIPHVWDQRYNAHVVRRLAAGFVLENTAASPRRLARYLERLVDADGPARRAEELSRDLRRDCGSSQILRLLYSLRDSRAAS